MGRFKRKTIRSDFKKKYGTEGEGLLRKKCCSFGFCPNEGGAAYIFWNLFLSAYLVNERSLFYQFLLQNANSLNFKLFF